MSSSTRSAKGNLIDFELLAIKAQLAAAPKPKTVEQRQAAIDANDGVTTSIAPDLNTEIFAVSNEAVATSAGKQIKKK
ncbi:MAG: hypothetical protein DDT31_01118 [Syntrophomonadaceae bacterium]|nr:hypothetical protein [Bacillota bacterium]